MIIKRPANERGHANHGWLDTYHTFSFAGYRNPEFDRFRCLRVLNDDTIAPGQGFGTHGHDNMEIVTYVLDGALEHRDSMGSGSVLRAGDVQRMSAGTGITHSEFNHSKDHPLRLLQIWLLPERTGLTPGYEEQNFPLADRLDQLRLIVSPDGADGSLTIHQDVRIHAGILSKGTSLDFSLAPGRHAWVQVADGSVRLHGMEMQVGDGAAVSGETSLTLDGQDGEVLLFDLP